MVPGLTRINIPSSIIVGSGASLEVATYVKLLGATRVLLVTDRFLASNGVVDRIVECLQSNGVSVAIYADVYPDPTLQNVYDGLRLYSESNAEAIVALGGGSPLDTAKAISILTTNPLPLSQYMGYHKIPRPGVPLIAIPTTAGTGSEVTKVTVITDTDNSIKMMLFDHHLLPSVALVDYELTMSMPQPLTAHVGVDTLTHAIEAYVSRKANLLTDPIALSCIQLVSKFLVQAWTVPDDHPARAAMAIAATQGGMAFSNSSVCLVHGMSRPIGAFFHVPHGLSNAVLLPTITRFSIPGALPRYAMISRMMGYATNDHDDETAAKALVDGLEQLNQSLNIPRLRDCVRVDRLQFADSVQKMAADALASGSPQNNPIVPTAEQIVELYWMAW
ncbi:MAG: iron-containing alcohol dehydrogenase [Anaerolineae bacterium]|nr:iron-containing alcohol dehydrogenase [Anaerolineae bacterium]